MCFSPVILEKQNFQPVPCGRCYECKKRNVHGWAFRLMQEEKQCITSDFCTLTYDDENVPITRYRRQSVWKKDPQRFFKRLRKAHAQSGEVSAIKYFLCSEYGGQTKRPHYHCIIFNSRPSDIEKAWNHGSVHFGDVSAASIYYTLKYMLKPSDSTLRKKSGSADPKRIYFPHKEFQLSSKGLGSAYCKNANLKAWHKLDLENRCYLNLTDGKKIAMPRYYKQKLYNEEEMEVVSYAGLLKAREKAEKDKTSPKELHERILASYLHLEFERRSRRKL